tara:strand:- start:1210 stop:2517 length:1308 start_codon:yes stop_codon:yes gene_type:complete
MKDKFFKNIIDTELFLKNDKLLLAISGGADSVALALLLKEGGYNFEMAHCNFNLRGEESDADEDFVKILSETLGVHYHTKTFNTNEYASKNKISVQMAARNLRYNWFEELKKETQSDYIVVAHHKDDDIETFFINLIRGSGIKGFLGMKQKRNKIIRPLLLFSRKEIEEYLKNQGQEFRNDSSNTDVKYLRNNIRHHLIPLIKDINPSFSDTFSKEIEYMNEVYNVFNDNFIEVKNDIVSKMDKGIVIDKQKLLSIQNNKIFLREIITPFGFNETDKILESCIASSGKMFCAKNYRLLIDRDKIFVTEFIDDSSDVIVISEDTDTIRFPIPLKFSISHKLEFNKRKNSVFLDFDKLEFPLKIRRWEEGDYFYPLGLNGRKKLSDYFVDNKFSRFEKEECFLLCSGEDIIWIIGHRMDDRFKITSNTKKVYIAELF